jgi:hypothetical protein
MGASGVGDQRVPLSPFGTPESLAPELLAPEVVPGPPELDPLEPADPLDPLDDAPAFPEPEELELDPVPELAPLAPDDAPDPESRALVSSEEAGEKPPPLLPEHPSDAARDTRSTARTRASSAIMDGRASQRPYRGARTAICGVYRHLRGETPSPVTSRRRH